MRIFRICILASLSFLIVFTSCTNEPKSFEEEVRQIYKGTRGFYYLKIPPALLTMFLKIADDKEMMDFFGNARKVGIIYFGEETGNRENNEMVKELEAMLAKYDFVDLIRISDSRQLISMKIKEKDGIVTDLVAVVSQDRGPVTGITLSGEIDVETIVKMAADLDFDKLMKMQEMVRK